MKKCNIFLYQSNFQLQKLLKIKTKLNLVKCMFLYNLKVFLLHFDNLQEQIIKL
jgi:hypothetical protein